MPSKNPAVIAAKREREKLKRQARSAADRQEKIDAWHAKWGWPKMTPEEGQQYLDQLAAAKQCARDEYLANPPVQQFSRQTWEKTANKLAMLFNPTRGFLTGAHRKCTHQPRCAKAREDIYETILRCSYVQADLIVRLARSFTSDAIIPSWMNLYPHNNLGEPATAQPPLFREGHSAFVKEFGREFARYMIQQRRETKQEREAAVVYMLLIVSM